MEKLIELLYFIGIKLFHEEGSYIIVINKFLIPLGFEDLKIIKFATLTLKNLLNLDLDKKNELIFLVKTLMD